jgi:subtilisin family serine protease
MITAGLAAVVTVVGISTPTMAAPAPDPYGGAAEPVALVVGMRPGADQQASIDRLDDRGNIDVLDSAPVPGTSAVTVEVASDDVDRAEATLARDPAVRYVEKDHVARAAALDPYRPQQWSLDRTGVAGAWGRTTGSAAITVAIVDTGVSPVSELAGRLLPGYNAITGGTDATDDNGHGTAAATVLAAQGDNGDLVAGVCWTCRILPVKVLGADGAGDYSDIADGVIWAADNGADIINLSLGGADDGQVLREAVAYAVASGVLVIAAAGNSASTSHFYPAALPDVLAVGASSQTDTRNLDSNYGPDWVDIAAPGCNLAQNHLDEAPGIVEVAIWACGTSFAAPLVAGVAALALSVRPGATAAQISTVLTSTAYPMPGLAWVASGRVNATAAVDTRAPSVSVLSPAPGALVRGTVTVGVSATDDWAVRRVQLIVAGQIKSTDTAAPWAPTWASGTFNGPITVTVRGYDAVGKSTVATRVVTVDNTPPTVAITRGPANGTRRIRGTVALAAAAADRYGVHRVELLINGRKVATDTTAGYTFAIDTSRYGSTLRVQLRAYDRAGNLRASPLRTWYRY